MNQQNASERKGSGESGKREPEKKTVLLKRKEAARLLGVSMMHISNLIDSGQLRAVNLATPGSRYRMLRIPISELNRFVSGRLL
ncbi:MAG: helix-turn-helix domain-containing protein [Limisphaerales bacterium]|jgi:excisionase family DNA binding protein|nr:helix-turn-helix domain-containing protein [Verrucomicrobiota bacterium]